MLGHPIIIALDVPNASEMKKFLSLFRDKQLFVKVGMELFYREGMPLLHELKENGHNVFLDVKCHDIPTTVYKTMKNLSESGVDLVNVHALGGSEMMKAARLGLDEGTQSGNRPLCIAVTQLTSTDEAMATSEMQLQSSVSESVSHLAKLAQESGMDGVVASNLETRQIKQVTTDPFAVVTPGIRMLHDAKDDQRRVVTPKQARTYGSDAIVVGRSITKAQDPIAAYEVIEKEWRE
ncbi:orotidine-5'-phosphate decarboxylase [Texcoconibacillus texcoconensis]|uniref:Orotidine 5'-phosphate decarboxylase n=1 Tax=Texcoconibacillus texcoconensis TaxID=1095777 RepID=A0A840QLA1_9BACI|nr:orotidine-5'-phosphate decarboxylase [Texcoconibacillus texcoconensis]MBB5172142.1 orotidine-5'-phosphate decarboxylase [Texcoconibacillus texcoconensis]